VSSETTLRIGSAWKCSDARRRHVRRPHRRDYSFRDIPRRSAGGSLRATALQSSQAAGVLQSAEDVAEGHGRDHRDDEDGDRQPEIRLQSAKEGQDEPEREHGQRVLSYGDQRDEPAEPPPLVGHSRRCWGDDVGEHDEVDEFQRSQGGSAGPRKLDLRPEPEIRNDQASPSRIDPLLAAPAGRHGWPWTEVATDQSQSPPPEGWPRITVVTPSYNQGQYIEETIRSVLLQRYPNLEYIIVDGGSDDGSVEIIRRYEPWLTAWVSEPDRGQAHAINKGWRQATGALLAYLNTDDVYTPGALAMVARVFAIRPDAGIVYGRALIVDEGGLPLRTWAAEPFDLGRMLTIGNHVPQSSAFFAASAVERLGPLDERWDAIMDYELCIRIGTRYPTICEPAVLSRFRDHPSSKTRRRHDVLARELIEYVTALQIHDADGQAERVRARALARVNFEWAMASLAHEQGHATAALRHLGMSLRLAPGFALRRPLDSAYIAKEAALATLGRRRAATRGDVRAKEH
jgi:glycosyltransferase involved in cell wall biosynthesis